VPISSSETAPCSFALLGDEPDVAEQLALEAHALHLDRASERARGSPGITCPGERPERYVGVAAAWSR
jgi:hypothetical protein